MSRNGHDSSHDDIAGPADEIEFAEKEMSQLIAGALAMWFVRWVIGFALIGLVTWFRPDWSWLWWAGVAVASASLVFTLGMQFVLQRKMAQARETEAKLHAALANVDDEET